MRRIILDERTQGITLVEVMIAVVVLSVATLGVMGALTYGVVSNEYAGTYSEANHAAREIAEGVRATQLAFLEDEQPAIYAQVFDNTKKPIGDPPFDGSFVGGLPDLSAAGPGRADSSATSGRFERTVTATEIAPNLHRIEVTVYWEMKGTEKKVSVVAMSRDTLGGNNIVAGGSGNGNGGGNGSSGGNSSSGGSGDSGGNGSSGGNGNSGGNGSTGGNGNSGGSGSSGSGSSTGGGSSTSGGSSSGGSSGGSNGKGKGN